MSIVRLLIRLLLSLGLLLSAAAVGPLAAADEADGSAASSASPSPDPDGATDGRSDGTSQESAAPSTPVSPSAPGTADPSAEPRALDSAAAAAAVPDTRITRHPANPSVSRKALLKYSADNSLASFECWITGPGRHGTRVLCPDNGRGGSSATGQKTYPRLRPSKHAYTFKVRSFIDVDRSGTTNGPDVIGDTASYRWRVYSLRSPRHVIPSTGATFNNPLGSRRSERRNLTHVMHAIDSMPGYAQPADSTAPCPTLRSGRVPSRIRITLYSMTDGPFARAAIRAARRCVSVQLLMNNHLTRTNDPAFRTLQNALGKTRTNRSFARRCISGCRGGGVLHTKMYLFDSAPLAHSRRIQNTVMVGSSNMTQNASGIQWNDLYTVKRAKTMYKRYSHYFDLMKKDDGFHRNSRDYVNGRYRTTFWPVTTNRPDPQLAAVRSIKCSGARGGTGINGHSIVYINMHAWFGLRGLRFVKAVRSLYSRGCYIRILYSFMTPRVYYRLHHATNSRMSLRRSIFSLNGDKYADVYTHFKNITASGNIGSDHSSRVVWTGSNNFTSDGDHFDEIMLRIKSSRAFRAYRNHFQYMVRRKSSSRYASFLEPVGGGRAPKQSPQAQFGARFAPETPVIISPDVIVDENGNPRALD